MLIDKDGSAYLFYSSEKIYVAKLKPNMTEIEGEPTVLDYLPKKDLQEGPFAFERNGTYYLTYPRRSPVAPGSTRVRSAAAPGSPAGRSGSSPCGQRRVGSRSGTIASISRPSTNQPPAERVATNASETYQSGHSG